MSKHPFDEYGLTNGQVKNLLVNLGLDFARFEQFMRGKTTMFLSEIEIIYHTDVVEFIRIEQSTL
jgi:hypothetical protein